MTELPMYGPETMTDEELEREISFALGFNDQSEIAKQWLQSLQDELEKRNAS